MSANLEQAARLADALKAFNQECGYLFDFSFIKAHAPLFETMAQVADLRGKPKLAAELRTATDNYFSQLNAQVEAPRTPRWDMAVSQPAW